MKMGLHNAVFMTEEKKDRPKKEVGERKRGREKVGVIRKEKNAEQLRKFKLDETHPNTGTSPFKIHFASLIYY